MAFFVYEPNFNMEPFVAPPRRGCCQPRYRRCPRQFGLSDDMLLKSQRGIDDFDKIKKSFLDSFVEAFAEKSHEESKKTEVEASKKTGEAVKDTESTEKTEVGSQEIQKSANQVAEQSQKRVSKHLATRVGINEDLNKVEINIEFVGHRFKPEDLEAQVIDGNVLLIKADDKFERKFQLSSKCQVDKIEPTFNCKDEEKQTLSIKIPKEVNIVQVPISMEE